MPHCPIAGDASAPNRGAEYCDDRVCLFVYLQAHLQHYLFDLHPIVCACYLCRGSVLLWCVVICYVLIYFRFYGRRHFCTQWPGIGDAVVTQWGLAWIITVTYTQNDPPRAAPDWRRSLISTIAFLPVLCYGPVFVCLSVTSRCSVETDERILSIFDVGRSSTVLRYFIRKFWYLRK